MSVRVGLGEPKVSESMLYDPVQPAVLDSVHKRNLDLNLIRSYVCGGMRVNGMCIFGITKVYGPAGLTCVPTRSESPLCHHKESLKRMI